MMIFKSIYRCLAILAFLLAYCYATTESDVPRGHMQQLGCHRDPEGHVDILTEPPLAEEFWRKYVSKRRPFLIKGAANNYPAKKLWTDEYLINEYGDLSVKLESKHEVDGNPIGTLGLARDTIRNFINTYKEKNKYIVSQLPKAMYKDMLVLPSLSCGSFKNSLVEINMWMSNGQTKSLLHKDAPNIMNCLLQGTKDWIMISPKHEYMVPLAKEPSMAGGGYSVLNVDRVDLKKFSKFKDTPWHYANVTAGDCLFVPYGYLHHVRSYGDRNLAVSYLFSRSTTHLKEFNNEGCDKQQYKKLTDLTVAWDFDGTGSLTMGLQEPEFYRQSFLAIFGKKKNMTTKSYMNTLSEHMLPDNPKRAAAARSMVTRTLNLEDKKYIHIDYIVNLPIESIKKVIYNMEMDPSNTLYFEYRLFSQESIKSLLESCQNKDGGLNTEKIIKLYQDDIGGSEKIAKEFIAKFDTDNDGKISAKERKTRMKEVLDLFDDEMPEEHVNDYYDTFIYRQPREEVPESDEMNYDFAKKDKDIDDGDGISITKKDSGELDPDYFENSVFPVKQKTIDEYKKRDDDNDMEEPDKNADDLDEQDGDDNAEEQGNSQEMEIDVHDEL